MANIKNDLQCLDKDALADINSLYGDCECACDRIRRMEGLEEPLFCSTPNGAIYRIGPSTLVKSALEDYKQAADRLAVDYGFDVELKLDGEYYTSDGLRYYAQEIIARGF